MDTSFKVPIKNIYYILCYAWNIVDYIDLDVCGDEKFDYIHNLLGRILLKETSTLIKRGYHKEYIQKTEELSKIKGHIEISTSIQQMTKIRKRMICSFDEYSSDVLINQIIKSTLFDLLKYQNLDKKLSKDIKRVLSYFDRVSYIEVNKKHFEMIHINKNNRQYEIIMNVCKLFRNGLISNKSKDIFKFSHFVDEDQMSKVYEKFIFNFYQLNLDSKMYKVHSPRIYWDINDSDDSFFPEMQTDIVIENNVDKKQLIIDAKYYRDTFTSRFDNSKQKIRNAHVNQIFAYMSMSTFDGEIKGMLLYPTVYEEVDVTRKIQNRFDTSFKTLNLDLDWNDIESRLLNFIH